MQSLKQLVKASGRIGSKREGGTCYATEEEKVDKNPFGELCTQVRVYISFICDGRPNFSYVIARPAGDRL